MVLFSYTLILMLIAVAGKMFQIGAESYLDHYLGRDMVLLLAHYFGLIALWGRAKNRPILGRKMWKVYLVLVIFSILLVPVFDPAMQASAKTYGWAPIFLGYGLSSLLLLPYLWGLYDYAWRRSRLWSGR